MAQNWQGLGGSPANRKRSRLDDTSASADATSSHAIGTGASLHAQSFTVVHSRAHAVSANNTSRHETDAGSGSFVGAGVHSFSTIGHASGFDSRPSSSLTTDMLSDTTGSCNVRSHREATAKLALAEALREHDKLEAERTVEDLQAENAGLRAQLEAVTAALESHVKKSTLSAATAADRAQALAAGSESPANMAQARAEAAAARADAAAAARQVDSLRKELVAQSSVNSASIRTLEDKLAQSVACMAGAHGTVAALRAQILAAGLQPVITAGAAIALDGALTASASSVATDSEEDEAASGSSAGAGVALAVGSWPAAPGVSFSGFGGHGPSFGGQPLPASNPFGGGAKSQPFGAAPALAAPPPNPSIVGSARVQSADSALAEARDARRAVERELRGVKAQLAAAREGLARSNEPLLLQQLEAAMARAVRHEAAAAEAGRLQTRLESALNALQAWHDRVARPLLEPYNDRADTPTRPAQALTPSPTDEEGVAAALAQAHSAASAVASCVIDMQGALTAARSTFAGQTARLNSALLARAEAYKAADDARSAAVTARKQASLATAHAQAAEAQLSVADARAARLTDLIRAAESSDKTGAALASALAQAHTAIAAAAASGGVGKGAVAIKTAQIAAPYEAQMAAAVSAVSQCNARVSELHRLLDASTARETRLVATLQHCVSGQAAGHPAVLAAQAAHVTSLQAEVDALQAESSALYRSVMDNEKGSSGVSGAGAQPEAGSLESEPSGRKTGPLSNRQGPKQEQERNKDKAHPYRILHLVANPSSSSYSAWEAKQRAALETMRKEVAAARAALAACLAQQGTCAGEQDGPANAGSSAPTPSLMNTTSSMLTSTEREDFDKYRARIKDLFKSRARALRDAVQLLTGWTLHLPEQVPASNEAEGGGSWEVSMHSVYAEAEGDVLKFAIRGSAVSMLETAYTARLPASAFTALRMSRSYPAFMASLTLEGVEKSTLSGATIQ